MPATVSVIVPTFRRPAQLAEAIRSALAEPETCEVLVADDSPEGSAQQTAEAIGDARVKYLKNPEPSGGKPALPRNFAAAHAQGDYLHFLDDDDRVAPGAFAALTAALEKDSGAGVAFGVVEPFGEEPALTHERAYFRDAAKRARAASRAKLWMVATMLHQPTPLVNSACILRRRHFAELGGYRPHVAPIEDVDFYLRAIRSFGVRFVDRVVLQYRVGHVSLMHAPQLEERCKAAHAHLIGGYREAWGDVEYRALQVFARTVLRFV